MELLKIATGLQNNLEDRSTEGRMSDSYALELFSYDSFVALIAHSRFEAAFYIFPFVCLNEAVRNANLKRNERFIFLKMAFRVFLYHYQAAKNMPQFKMFPQKYSKTALGTTFGELIFIKRCLSTTVAYGIALNLNIPLLGLHRIGTHCVEQNFGVMRMLQRDINTPQTGIKAAAKACIVQENNSILDIQTHVNTRENNGGAKLDPHNERESEHLFFNPNLFPDILYNLMINANVSVDTISNFVMQINSYTDIYTIKPTTKISGNFQFTSAKPYSRYLSVSNYRLTTSPIPIEVTDQRICSPIAYYFTYKQNNKKEELKLQQWSNVLLSVMQNIIKTQRTLELTYEEVRRRDEIQSILLQIKCPRTKELFSTNAPLSNFSESTSEEVMPKISAPPTPARSQESSFALKVKGPKEKVQTAFGRMTRGHQMVELAKVTTSTSEKIAALDTLFLSLKELFDKAFEQKFYALEETTRQIIDSATIQTMNAPDIDRGDIFDEKHKFKNIEDDDLPVQLSDNIDDNSSFLVDA